MSLFSFIKEAGEKLFGSKPSPEETNASAATSIAAYIEKQNLGIEALKVAFDSTTGTATVTGTAPTQDACEKVTLACGNVANVAKVENQLTVTKPADESQFHDVVSGDTLSAIAKKYYGNAGKYMVIFEANKPMLSHPDKIYPGQKLRIPKAS